tara:strand:- start:64796 stop:67204 length:2409 start_codon:yes stop_codon:yes gene_type:complete
MAKKRHYTIIKFLLLAGISLVVIAVIGIMSLEQDLPDVDKLKNVQMQVPLRVFSADNKLIGEFGEKKRIPVQLADVPPQLIHAIVATEDRRFWEHSGVDVFGLARAGLLLITTGHKTQGGSTITMQVARNFFLTRKKTYIRKIREILLALKISRELSKDKVLELYLNKVYFGQRAYGAAAAAQVYYGEQIQDLTLPQMAMIAGLPKAPSAINPLSNPTAAIERRHHVLSRMLEQGYINQQQFQQADATPLTATFHNLRVQLYAPYVAEEIRDGLVKKYGNDAYTMGFTVHTTINSKLQRAANRAVRTAVLAYDKRHGYRGPQANWGETITPEEYPDFQRRLKKLTVFNGLQPALVTNVEDKQATVLLASGEQVTLPWSTFTWAGKALKSGWKTPPPKSAEQVLSIGDLIYVEQLKNGGWGLSQVPEAEGAIVALNPQDGGITAMVGGFSYVKSKFDRVMQAQRQPGSGFKPFVYSAALNKGLTLATLVNDAPVVTQATDEVGLWRPQNDTRQFYGPTRLRVGLMKSRNLVSVRLLQEIGISYAITYMKRFGFSDANLPHSLSLALGAGDLTPLQLASGYAVFANGGFLVKPYLISKVTNENGTVVQEVTPKVACEDCDQTSDDNTSETLSPAASAPPENLAPRIITPQNAYLITSAMQSVIQEGTGGRAKVLGRTDLAGKTGTTNEQRDAWFSGFNSDIVTVAWMGFDQPKSLKEYGAQAALPMWIDFMRSALHGTPEHTMARPNGLVTMRIDPSTGLAAGPNDPGAIFETFRQQNAPKPYVTEKGDDNNQTTAPSVYQPLY